MHQISPIKNKILQYIEYKGISKYKFYQESGITRGVLDKESGISEDNIAKFIAYAPEVDLSWLFLDQGKMLKNKEIEKTFEIGDFKNGKKLQPEMGDISGDKQYEKVFSKLKFDDEIKIVENGIPFYSLPVSAGKLNELLELTETPTGYINLPGVHCDAFFPIVGASFEPYIKAGDIIGINFIDKWENLDPDCIYLIITYDQRMIKRLMHHPDDSTLLICISPNYKEFTIDKFTIRYIHKVTFCGRAI